MSMNMKLIQLDRAKVAIKAIGLYIITGKASTCHTESNVRVCAALKWPEVKITGKQYRMLEVDEGHMPQSPIAGNANAYTRLYFNIKW